MYRISLSIAELLCSCMPNSTFSLEKARKMKDVNVEYSVQTGERERARVAGLRRREPPVPRGGGAAGGGARAAAAAGRARATPRTRALQGPARGRALRATGSYTFYG